MPKSVDELLEEDTRQQIDEERGIEVPVSQKASMNELVKLKKKHPPNKQRWKN